MKYGPRVTCLATVTTTVTVCLLMKVLSQKDQDPGDKEAPRSAPAVRPDPCGNGSLHAGYTCGQGLRGRLGNALFVYASAYSLARRTHRCLYMSSRVKKYLTPILSLNIQTRAPDATIDVTERHFATYDAHLRNCAGNNVRINGYLQSWKYFSGLEEALRKRLELRLSLVKFAKTYLGQLEGMQGAGGGSTPPTLVAVHVRIGDKTNKASTKMGFTTAPATYIHRAMDYYRRTFEDVLFVVGGDDLAWCRRHLQGRDVHVLEEMDAVKHFAVLASCQHTVVTVGTFGWWVAWFVGGQTVYYHAPLTNSSPLVRDFTPQDYFYPTWLGMS